MIWTELPVRAWRKYIRTDAADARWINDGSTISSEIPLRKRELFGLIVLAYLYGRQWRVGYDPNQPEPNDGLILTGKTKICFEHKVIVEEASREVLDEILETYRKQAQKGPDYGKGRTLVIQPNKSPKHGGMVKISDLMHEIGDSCHFDRVFTLGQVKRDGDIGIIHAIQHFPRIKSGIAEVEFNYVSGRGYVTHNPLDM